MNLKKGLASGLLGLTFVGVLAAPAFATVVNVGGGKWDYGQGDETVWSNYSHPDNCHSSSVKVGDTTFGSGATDAGKTSYASAKRSFWYNESSYYNPNRTGC